MNLIFDLEDEDAGEENNYSYARNQSCRERSNLGEIMRDGMEESSTDLLEETHMQSSEVFIYGSGSEAK